MIMPFCEGGKIIYVERGHNTIIVYIRSNTYRKELVETIQTTIHPDIISIVRKKVVKGVELKLRHVFLRLLENCLLLLLVIYVWLLLCWFGKPSNIISKRKFKIFTKVIVKISIEIPKYKWISISSLVTIFTILFDT